MSTDPLVNPWIPMNKPIDLKHLGKLAEELAEALAAVSRCIIQGINESEPITGKSNKEWLEEELADVDANIFLVRQHFRLDLQFIRYRDKLDCLRRWHSMLK